MLFGKSYWGKILYRYISKILVNPLTFVFVVLSFIIILFISLPILAIISQETLGSLVNTFKDPIVRNAIILSMMDALFATLIALVFGIPLAYLLARKEFIGKSVIQGIVDLPVVIPHTVAGIALLLVFSAHGLIGAPLATIGVKFVDAEPGIIIAMLFVSAPFVINSAKDGFAAVDPRLESVARSLGASQTKTFFTIALPLAARAIVTGSVMSWARAISEFGAVVVIAYYPMIAPTLIYERFTAFGLEASRPIAVLLILICLAVFIALRICMILSPKLTFTK